MHTHKMKIELLLDTMYYNRKKHMLRNPKGMGNQKIIATRALVVLHSAMNPSRVICRRLYDVNVLDW